jgi:hypothetical protein
MPPPLLLAVLADRVLLLTVSVAEFNSTVALA